ncbi:hypothetical protein ACFVXQ_11935, partial [Kitasatospora sp. NPDC058263]
MRRGAKIGIITGVSVAVLTALRRKGAPEAADEACRRAAALLPADPTPWLGLLLLSRAFGTEEE